jgi:hypothetical protein
VVWRLATGWMIRGSSPGRGWEFFSAPPRPRPALGPIQPHIQWVPRIKWAGREADHSPPFSAEVKNA